MLREYSSLHLYHSQSLYWFCLRRCAPTIQSSIYSEEVVYYWRKHHQVVKIWILLYSFIIIFFPLCLCRSFSSLISFPHFLSPPSFCPSFSSSSLFPAVNWYSACVWGKLNVSVHYTERQATTWRGHKPITGICPSVHLFFLSTRSVSTRHVNQRRERERNENGDERETLKWCQLRKMMRNSKNRSEMKVEEGRREGERIHGQMETQEQLLTKWWKHVITVIRLQTLSDEQEDHCEERTSNMMKDFTKGDRILQ